MQVSPPSAGCYEVESEDDAFTTPSPVCLWLLLCAALVFLMVILGGLTRLTHSGLSMVQWQPLSLLPPLSQQDWQRDFALYQTSPEYAQINSGMDLAGFQSIYWLEYCHRLAGRLTGAVFALPLVAFWIKGALPPMLIRRLLLILGLGALQGLIGWLMVASGLVDVPQVSPLRLAAHLLMALTIYSALIWTVLDLWPSSHPTEEASPSSKSLSRLALGLAGITIAWGALVAGLHAGLSCDTFPLMYGRLFPDDGLAQTPLAINFIENPSTVQFTHRLLAATTLLFFTGLWLNFRTMTFAVPALWAWAQAALGVATLVLHVPVSLAALHQSGAVILLTLIVRTVHKMQK